VAQEQAAGVRGAEVPLSESHQIWQTREVDDLLAGEIARETGLPRPAARALVGRGISTAEDARSFLNPRLSSLSDPCALPGIVEAAERIERAIEKQERIAVFGDYDVDGVTSTVLLVSVLARLGAQVERFFPERERDGYGLTAGALERCLEELGPSLVITVDCGTNSIEAVSMAGERGVDVVVTDHHEISGELPAAVAVVNPQRWDGDAPRELAGVGVAFKLCHALIKRGLQQDLAGAHETDLREYLDIVAVGTVADISPLTGENRVIVRHGLQRIGRDGRLGLWSLLGKAKVRDRVEPYHVSFVIAPRLNAAGRLGTAAPAAELLLTGDADRASELSLLLDGANSDRKRIEDAILLKAQADAETWFDPENTFGVVTGGEGWHPGVIGIVASRLCETFSRPAVVVGFDGDGNGRGSCRGVKALDLVEVLGECADLLTTFGGHAMAAGISIARDNFDAFRSRFNEACTRRLEGTDLRRVQTVDAWIDLGEADRQLYDAVGSMGPFGVGNPAPVWGVREVRFIGEPRIVGQGHLKGLVGSGGAQMDMIGFGLGDRDIPDGPMDMVFQLQQNTYKGRTSLQMKVRDFRASG